MVGEVPVFPTRRRLVLGSNASPFGPWPTSTVATSVFREIGKIPTVFAFDQSPTFPETGSGRVCFRYSFPPKNPETSFPLTTSLSSCHFFVGTGTSEIHFTRLRFPFTYLKRTRFCSRALARRIR